MEQIPSFEAMNPLTIQEIPHTSWNPKVHYHSYKNPPTATILCQMKPVHTFPTIYLRPIFNSNLCSTPRFSKWSLSIRFSHQHHLHIFFFHIFNTKYHTQKHKILCPWIIQQPQNSNKQPAWFQVSFIIMTKCRRCNDPSHNSSQWPNNICKNSTYNMLSVISNGTHVLIKTGFTYVVDYQIVTVRTDGMLW